MPSVVGVYINKLLHDLNVVATTIKQAKLLTSCFFATSEINMFFLFHSQFVLTLYTVAFVNFLLAT